MKFKKIALSIVFFCVVYLIVLLRQRSIPKIVSHDSFSYSSTDVNCPIPIFAEEKLINDIPIDECQSEYHDWVYLHNNYVIFNDTEFHKYGGFRCYFNKLRWHGDFQISTISSWQPILNNTYLGNKMIKVICKSKGLFRYNEQYLMGFEDHGETTNDPDILIVGIDSLSRLAWKKYLPMSYEYLETELNDSSVIFKKVNVRGDGTTVNLLAILTGEEETELYESRRNQPGAKHVDDYPWIWKTLFERNYTTLFDEDDIDFGSFQYRLMGFKNQPTDYYGRTWRLVHKLRRRAKNCMNQWNAFQFQMDMMKHFFQRVKGPKFAFIWSSQFSHNINENVRKIDTDLLELLTQISNPTSIFNNSIFILLSDHGHRFHSRYHLQGKYEERLPFLTINIPKSIRKQAPHLVKNMKLNENKLVTLLDVHETILDTINKFPTNKTYDVFDMRKMSLYRAEIPNRNCQQIKLPMHWCVCLKFKEIDIGSEKVINSARYAVSVINREIEEYRSKCHLLELSEIIRAHLVTPSDDVITFYQSDRDGRKGDFSDKTFVSNEYYQVLFKTKPGNAVFETTINVIKWKQSNSFNVNIKDVDRNDRYASWIWCITNDMRDVRKFCLCY